jgi:TonB-dependent receptor
MNLLKMKSRMQNKFVLQISVVLGVFINSLLGQGSPGRIGGKIVDAENGESLIGANVYLDQTTLGAASDLDGSFLIPNVPPGTYTLIVSVVGYAETRIIDVQVSSDEMTKLDLAIQPEMLTTETITVEARALKNNEASLLKDRQKSDAISDAISAEMISRTASGDAAEAMQKVTGASIVDNKYVYVRGLGERYSITQLNGAELPSSDPDRKAFQLDLIPSNLLDNIKTVKTFTPDKPGNFTGGAVDIGTKTFPDDFTMKIRIGTQYNSQSNGNPDFLMYQGGKTDWLGFDDGTRDIPEILQESAKIPLAAEARFDEQKAADLNRYSTAFNNIMEMQTNQMPLDAGLAFSIGDKIQIGSGSTIGYQTNLTYARKYSAYSGGQVGRYRLNLSAETLNPQLIMSDAKSTQETNLGALADITLNITPEQQIGFNLFYNRSGISSSRRLIGYWPQEIDDENRPVSNRVLQYVERDIQSYQFKGEHFISALYNLHADWSVTLASTKQDEPDRRHIFDITDVSDPEDPFYSIVGSNFDDPARYWRFLSDKTNTYNLNFSLPFSLYSGLNSKLKFGFNQQDAKRDFSERIFSWFAVNSIYNDVGGDPSLLFENENNGITSIDTLAGGSLIRHNFGNTVYDFSKPKNSYNGDQTIRAYYGMIDVPVTRKLRFIGGVRYETTKTFVKSQDEQQGVGSVDEKDWLPSLNFVYSLNPAMNLRMAGTKTLARPNFRELAPYSTQEFVNDFILRGNPDLKRTRISNFDLRWEWFTNPGEVFAVSAFYKELQDPIEMAFATGTTQSNPIVEYKNVPRATIQGLEFEVRLGLGYLANSLNNFAIGSNLSLIDSDVDIAQSELDIAQGIDSTFSSTRNLQGQSDYILNVDLVYNNMDWGTTASLYYNIFGERLSIVSANITPDVFEQPTPQLDFIISQKMTNNLSLKFTAQNILNRDYNKIYRYNGQEYIYHSYKRGTSFSIRLNYEI